MSQRRNFRLAPSSRAFIVQAVQDAPDGSYVDLHTEPKRTREQNDRMWPMLDDLAEQLPWRDWQGNTIMMDSDQWKEFFLAILYRDQLMVMNPEGTGMVLVRSKSGSSQLRVSEASELLTLIETFAVERGVK